MPMTNPSIRPSATIYDFASRARAILAARGQSATFLEQAPVQLPRVDYGSGWYHEAAIQEEAERTRRQ